VLVVLLVVALVVALGVVWFVGMRHKGSPVVAFQRRFNKKVVNPRQMKDAGRPGAYASVIRHVGRTSGRAYETPVEAIPTDDGFAIALVYGRRSDWAQNVLASGTATVVREGEEFAVGNPEIVPIDQAAAWMTDKAQRSARRFGIEDVLLLHAG
jgi:deazaflavin-dependent oxidoreductase (nitroreductase family)